MLASGLRPGKESGGGVSSCFVDNPVNTDAHQLIEQPKEKKKSGIRKGERALEVIKELLSSSGRCKSCEGVSIAR